jgi:hypothetical protein
LILKSSIAPDQGAIDIEETFSGNDGDVESEAGSVDQSGNYVFEAVPQLETWTSSRTICYWTISGDTNTMISLWNYSGAPEDLVLTLHFEAGSYRVPIHLEAGADLDLDLASLFRSRVPDDHGTVLPSNIIEGSATLASVEGESAEDIRGIKRLDVQCAQWHVHKSMRDLQRPRFRGLHSALPGCWCLGSGNRHHDL